MPGAGETQVRIIMMAGDENGTDYDENVFLGYIDVNLDGSNLSNSTYSGVLYNIVDNSDADGLDAKFAWNDQTVGSSAASSASTSGNVNTPNRDITVSISGSSLIVTTSGGAEPSRLSLFAEYLSPDADSLDFAFEASDVLEIAGGDDTANFSITGTPEIIRLDVRMSRIDTGQSTVEYKGAGNVTLQHNGDGTYTASGIMYNQAGSSAGDDGMTFAFSGYSVAGDLVPVTNGSGSATAITASAVSNSDTSSISANDLGFKIYFDGSGNLVVEQPSSFTAEWSSLYQLQAFSATGVAAATVPYGTTLLVDPSDASNDTLVRFDSITGQTDIDGADVYIQIPTGVEAGYIRLAGDGGFKSDGTSIGDDTQENGWLLTGFVDLVNGTTSGISQGVRTTTPDLVSWGSVSFGTQLIGFTGTQTVSTIASGVTSNHAVGEDFADSHTGGLTFSKYTDGSGDNFLRIQTVDSNTTFGSYDLNGVAISWDGPDNILITFSTPGCAEVVGGTQTAADTYAISVNDLSNGGYIQFDEDFNGSGCDITVSNGSDPSDTEGTVITVTPVNDKPELSVDGTPSYELNAAAVTVDGSVAIADVDDTNIESASITIENIDRTNDVLTLSSAAQTIASNNSVTITAYNSTTGVLSLSGSASLAVYESILEGLQFSSSSSNTNDRDVVFVVNDGDDNSDAGTATVSVTADVTAPGAPTVAIQDGGDGVLNAADVASGVDAVITLPSDALEGDELQVDTDGDNVADVTVTLTATDISNGSVTIDVPPGDVPANGSLTVAAKIVDVAGNEGSSANDSSTTDTAAPTITINTVAVDDVINATEDDADVVISGTVSGAENGQTITVTLNGKTYTDTVSGANWSVTVPAADAQALDANETVTADVSDAANNAATQATRAIEHDTVVTTPTVTSQTTNDPTPVITGTADSADDLTVTVNGETYTEGDGNLVDNGNDTWTLTIPGGDALSEDTYSVTATVTDSANNTASDTSSNELIIALDSDGDGIPDSVECSAGDPVTGIGCENTDSDGLPDYLDTDSDGDGIPDADEAGGDAENPLDTDGDGTPDFQDTDSDNDGTDDIDEGTGDSDGDGIPDYVDVPSTGGGTNDTDGDGIPDSVECPIYGSDCPDTDGDGQPDYNDTDSDNDGIDDEIEAGVDPDSPIDTDGDGTPDFQDTDSDNDSTDDSVEGTGDTDGDGIPDYLDADNSAPGDSDGDGLPDNVECSAYPLCEDSDGDGTPDYMDNDNDADNDGIDDATEAGLSGNDIDGDGIDDAWDVDQTGGLDLDGDGIDDAQPIDTDGDGTPDYLDEDADGDGKPDASEGTGDSDSDGIPDYMDPFDQNGPTGDVDGDGVINHNDPDDDNDGLADTTEDPNLDSDGNPATNPLDTDGDGIPDYQDLDSDGDGIPDTEDSGLTQPPEDEDTDGDGIPDGADADVDGDGNVDNGPDSDGDGINDLSDSDLGGSDADGDGINDANDNDIDGDGVNNAFDPDHDGGADGDADGVSDHTPKDDDNDGIPDQVDLDLGSNSDSDGDGVADEIECPTYPTDCADTDGDGLLDYLDADTAIQLYSGEIETGLQGIGSSGPFTLLWIMSAVFASTARRRLNKKEVL